MIGAGPIRQFLALYLFFLYSSFVPIWLMIWSLVAITEVTSQVTVIAIKGLIVIPFFNHRGHLYMYRFEFRTQEASLMSFG